MLQDSSGELSFVLAMVVFYLFSLLVGRRKTSIFVDNTYIHLLNIMHFSDFRQQKKLPNYFKSYKENNGSFQCHGGPRVFSLVVVRASLPLLQVFM